MFVIVYRWRLKAGREDEFAQSWQRMTELIGRQCGSRGSALFRGDDGTFSAIALWPDRSARERCSVDAEPELARMMDCVQERYPEQRLETVSNLWAFPDAR